MYLLHIFMSHEKVYSRMQEAGAYLLLYNCFRSYEVLLKYFVIFLEQVSASIHQEWRRLQRRKHLKAPSSPEMCTFSSYSPGSSPPRKDQPLFTLKQVTLICERMLKERETQVTEEYDKILREKLAGV